jgi:DNA-directed RNA polymerase subunit beta'
VPSQDIVLGLYYLSLMREGEPGRGQGLRRHGRDRACAARQGGHLHTKIKGRAWRIDENGKRVTKVIDTTPGRMIARQLLPKHPRSAVRRRQQADDQEGNLGNLIDRSIATAVRRRR